MRWKEKASGKRRNNFKCPLWFPWALDESALPLCAICSPGWVWAEGRVGCRRVLLALMDFLLFCQMQQHNPESETTEGRCCLQESGCPDAGVCGCPCKPQSRNFTSRAGGRGQLCVPGCRDANCTLLVEPFLLMARYSPPALRYTVRGKLIAKIWKKRGIFLHLPCIRQGAAQRTRFTCSGECSLVCPIPPLWEVVCMLFHHACAWQLKINLDAHSQLET